MTKSVPDHVTGPRFNVNENSHPLKFQRINFQDLSQRDGCSYCKVEYFN